MSSWIFNNGVGRRRRWSWALPIVGIAASLAAAGMNAEIASASPTPVGLGTATSFAVLAGTTVTNTGPSVVSGDLGVDPGSAVTGFPPGSVINGTQYAAGTPSAAAALQAQSDLTTAYNQAAGETPTASVSTDLGGQTLVPGVYAGGALSLTGTVTLDAENNPNAVFVFQAASTLITASASRVSLVGGAQACNVFWQVTSSATLGTGSSFVGSVMALTSITVDTGTTVAGRVLARNGEVSLDTDTITTPTCTSSSTVASPTTTPPTTSPPTTTPPSTSSPTTTPPTTSSPVVASPVVRAPVRITTSPSQRSVILGASVTDEAHAIGTVAGGVPTGSMRFYECGPASSSCTSASGTGIAPAERLKNGFARSPSFVPKAVGSYCFATRYISLDDHYRGSSQAGRTTNGECFTVSARPKLTTAPPAHHGTPIVVPITHTGEPWAGSLYWVLLAAMGGTGVALVGNAAYRRRTSHRAGD